MREDLFSLGEDVRAAVLTVDLLRGHLDPEHATLPLEPDAAARVVDANRTFLTEARELGMPIVHGVTIYTHVRELRSNPFWSSLAGKATSRRNVMSHNIAGSIGTELMPGILGKGDYVVDSKHRYSCFFETDLDFVLRHAGVNTLFITGVNTNSCVLATTIDAQMRDYAAVVVTDCVDSMDADLHSSALKCIERAFGWLMEFEEALTASGKAVTARV
jgi:nicotinamidase-related amidase